MTTTDSNTSDSHNGLAIVIGASGGIGAALVAHLQAVQGDQGDQGDSATAQTVLGAQTGQAVLGLSRATKPALDLLDENSIAQAAQFAQTFATSRGLELRLVIDATGKLHGDGLAPEKSWKQLDATQMAEAFAINAIGPALVMKHFLPLLAPQGKAVFATLSAKVGSIGDNRLGGWYSYRASKAALNQLVHTAAIELRRRQPQAICVALHPGTVATALSGPFAKTGLDVLTPLSAANRLLAVIGGLTAADSGGFFNHDGSVLPW